MPQLDKFAFFPQVFWLVLIFFLCYFSILQLGLPLIYRLLSFRRKQLDFYYFSSSNSLQENSLSKSLSFKLITSLYFSFFITFFSNKVSLSSFLPYFFVNSAKYISFLGSDPLYLT